MWKVGCGVWRVGCNNQGAPPLRCTWRHWTCLRCEEVWGGVGEVHPLILYGGSVGEDDTGGGEEEGGTGGMRHGASTSMIWLRSRAGLIRMSSACLPGHAHGRQRRPQFIS